MVVLHYHFHCTVENVGATVGADPRACPDAAEMMVVADEYETGVG